MAPPRDKRGRFQKGSGHATQKGGMPAKQISDAMRDDEGPGDFTQLNYATFKEFANEHGAQTSMSHAALFGPAGPGNKNGLLGRHRKVSVAR